MIDLTKITTPFGLLEDKTQQALRDHFAAGGKVEIFTNTCWDAVGAWVEPYCAPSFDPVIALRAKPKPLEFWVNEYPHGLGEYFGARYPTKEFADKNASTDRIRCIRLIEAPDQSEGV